MALTSSALPERAFLLGGRDTEPRSKRRHNYFPLLANPSPQGVLVITGLRWVTWWKKEIFKYPEGLIQELSVHQRKGQHKIFRCPMLDCGVVFRKSCDLTIHFNFEVGPLNRGQTGTKPFGCCRCGLSFRWSIQLKQHQAVNKCKKLIPPSHADHNLDSVLNL